MKIVIISPCNLDNLEKENDIFFATLLYINPFSRDTPLESSARHILEVFELMILSGVYVELMILSGVYVVPRNPFTKLSPLCHAIFLYENCYSKTGEDLMDILGLTHFGHSRLVRHFCTFSTY